MTHEAIKQLERFYFTVIDSAKEFRASCNKSERQPLKPLSENSLQQKSPGNALEILVDIDKENISGF